MKKILAVLGASLLLASPVMAGDFMLGGPGKGATIKLDGGKDLKLRIRLQPRLDTGDLITVDGVNEKQTDAYLRRVRLEASGHIAKNLKYGLVFEGDKTGKRGSGKDADIYYAYVNYKYSNAFNVRFGRNKLPYSRVSLTSSSRQLIIERPLSTEKGKKQFRDYYQTNLMLHGKVGGGVFAYNIALADGYQNEDKVHSSEDVKKSDSLYVARIELSPPGWVEKKKKDSHLGNGRHLTLGLSTAAQNSIETITDKQDRTLLGYDLSFHIGPITAQAEYIKWEVDSDVAGNDKESDGWHLQAGYYIRGINVEPAVRYEVYNHDRDASGDNEEKVTSAGFNWYLQGHFVKLGANYVTHEFGKALDKKDKNLIQVQGQVYS